MKKFNNGFYLGKYIYGEWLVPIHDYYEARNKTEYAFEEVIPFVISFIVTVIYHVNNLELKAISKLSDLLPNILSIIIGFTITCISVLLFNSDKTVEILKGKKTSERKVDGENINLYQFLLIQYIYTLIKEILFILLIFFINFISPFIGEKILFSSILFVYVYLILNIFFIIIRSVTAMYFMVFKS